MRKTLRHPSIEPSHPGAIILGSLEDANIKRSDLATALGISRNTLYKLLEGKQSMTAEMAIRVEAVMGGSAEVWMALQADHDLWHAQRSVDTKRLKRIVVRADADG